MRLAVGCIFTLAIIVAAFCSIPHSIVDNNEPTVMDVGKTKECSTVSIFDLEDGNFDFKDKVVLLENLEYIDISDRQRIQAKKNNWQIEVSGVDSNALDKISLTSPDYINVKGIVETVDKKTGAITVRAIYQKASSNVPLPIIIFMVFIGLFMIVMGSCWLYYHRL